MTKVVAIWYPYNVSVSGLHEVVNVDNIENIKNIFGDLLFDRRANALLVGYEGNLYVIEATDRENRLYSRRSIVYHPFSNLVLS
jgi:hypothetical protein